MLAERLAAWGKLSDDSLPVAQILLAVGALERNIADITAYEAHIVEMQDALTLYVAQEKPDTLNARLVCLHHIIRDKFGYSADDTGYDDPDNINMLQVIERRRGIPVALGVLYITLAHHQGWSIAGLNFPGHFLLRLEEGAQRLIFDPFHGSGDLQAPQLRQLLKTVLGPKAELSHSYYDAVTIRLVALRFCNNRKTRLIENENYEAAMRLISLEMAFAPDEPRLLFDAGMVCTRLQHIQQAMAYLERFIAVSPDTKTVAEARDVLRGLQRMLQ